MIEESVSNSGLVSDPDPETDHEWPDYPGYVPFEAWAFRNTTETWTPEEELVYIRVLDQPGWPDMTLVPYDTNYRIFTNETPYRLPSPLEGRLQLHIACSAGCGIKGIRCSSEGSMQFEADDESTTEFQMRYLNNSVVIWLTKGRSSTTHMEVWLRRVSPRVLRDVT